MAPPSKQAAKVILAVAVAQPAELRVRSTVRHGSSTGYVPGHALLNMVSPSLVQSMKRDAWIVLVAESDAKRDGFSRFRLSAKAKRFVETQTGEVTA